jgi:peptidyl-dipeptidase A
MTSSEMMTLLDRILAEIEPLFRQLHAYAKRELATRYGKAVPKRIPAHWIGNRWAQEWPGIVAGVDLDPLFVAMTPQQIVDHAQAFYTSMGFPELPQSFHDKSDLWELPPGSTRNKNTHASAWHMDLDQDVRSLMSVRADFNWFLTTHHELGHIHYYLQYSRPEVPAVLREGANRAFHEGIGELIALAASQQSYLRDVGVLKQPIDKTQWLLNDAMTSVPLLAWAAGVMSHFEHDLYDGDLPTSEFNERWWQYAQWYQGIDPPAPRPDSDGWCDAATKTHINDDPAQYYDYALATVIKFQLHEHIATRILKQDIRDANYRGSAATGEFLRGILAPGQTRDWRVLLREATGEDLSARAMIAYYQPLMDWLVEQNAKADTRYRDD